MTLHALTAVFVVAVAIALGVAYDPSLFPAELQDPEMVASTTRTALIALALAAGLTTIVKLWGHLRWWLRLKSVLDKSEIPVVKGGNTILGHALALNDGNAWNVVTKWVKEQGQFGMVRLRVLTKECVVVDDPAILKGILLNGISLFGKDVEFSYKPFMCILGTGLVTSDGQLWKKQRLMVSQMFKNELLDDVVSMASRAADRLSEKLERAKEKGETVEMFSELRMLTLQVITEVLLGIHHEESDKVFPDLYLPIMEIANKWALAPYWMYLPSPQWFEYHSKSKQLDNYMENFIQRRWDLQLAQRKLDCSTGGTAPTRENGRGDFLDRILRLIPEEEWDRETVLQLSFELKTFVLAGHETSAAMLTWALYELVINPPIMQALKAEVEPLLNGRKRGYEMTREEADMLPFSNCCLKEALRRYSVVPIVTRMVKKDTTLNGQTIPEGTTLMLSLQGIHNNPKYWDEPEQYRPERFLKEFDPYTFLPFLNGPRNCLGQHLALVESRVVLSTLCNRFNFRTLTKEEMKVNYGERDSYTIPIGPTDGMPMHIV